MTTLHNLRVNITPGLVIHGHPAKATHTSLISSLKPHAQKSFDFREARNPYRHTVSFVRYGGCSAKEEIVRGPLEKCEVIRQGRSEDGPLVVTVFEDGPLENSYMKAARP